MGKEIKERSRMKWGFSNRSKIVIVQSAWRKFCAAQEHTEKAGRAYAEAQAAENAVWLAYRETIETVDKEGKP